MYVQVYMAILILTNCVLYNAGLPPMTEADIGRLDAQTPLDLWRKAYLSLFPQQVCCSILYINFPFPPHTKPLHNICVTRLASEFDRVIVIDYI
jgi:hypothetical protein